jgi:hypothetical protein
VTLSGAAAFVGAGTYVCFASDTASPPADVEITYTSGTAFTPTSAVAEAVKFTCIGK